MKTIHNWKYFSKPSLENQVNKISSEQKTKDSLEFLDSLPEPPTSILAQIEEHYPSDMGITYVPLKEEEKLSKEENQKFFNALSNLENDPRNTLSKQENSVLSTSNTIEEDNKIKKQKFRETKKHGKSRKNQKQT